MDKSLILAVAGSGKTTLLVNRLDLKKRVLLLTFTDNNAQNLYTRIADKFGHIPPNIHLRSYFTFLNSFCYKPLFARSMRCRGISFQDPSPFSMKRPYSDDLRFLDYHRRVYHNRMAKLFEVRGAMPDLLNRVSRYYDAVYFDEVQDLGGHDFDFMEALISAKVETLWVGDFFQRTFSTSADGNVNSSLYNSLHDYCARLKKAGMTIDTQTLGGSHRCGKAICDFVSEKVGISIVANSTREVTVTEVASRKDADAVMACNKTVKLFFNRHQEKGVYSENWGGSKGLDHFEDVCVVLNKTTEKAYRKNDLRSLATLSRNKLYVACTRARGNLYLLPESLLEPPVAEKPKRPAAKKPKLPAAAKKRVIKAPRDKG